MVPLKSLFLVYYLAVLTGMCVLAHRVVATERLSVVVSVANIRSGPGTNYDVIWNVEKYFPFLVVEKSGDWYRFQDFEGDGGWIHKSLVGSTTSVITSKSECNIRSGPGTGFDILFSVGIGVPFRVLTQKGDWIHVEHADGDRGWIHNGLIW